MASGSGAGGKGGVSKGGGGMASNAALQDDEDRLYRGDHFRKWAKKKNEAKIIGSPIVYDKSPMPPKK